MANINDPVNARGLGVLLSQKGGDPRNRVDYGDLENQVIKGTRKQLKNSTDHVSAFRDEIKYFSDLLNIPLDESESVGDGLSSISLTKPTVNNRLTSKPSHSKSKKKYSDSESDSDSDSDSDSESGSDSESESGSDTGSSVSSYSMQSLRRPVPNTGHVLAGPRPAFPTTTGGGISGGYSSGNNGGYTQHHGASGFGNHGNTGNTNGAGNTGGFGTTSGGFGNTSGGFGGGFGNTNIAGSFGNTNHHTPNNGGFQRPLPPSFIPGVGAPNQHQHQHQHGHNSMQPAIQPFQRQDVYTQLRTEDQQRQEHVNQFMKSIYGSNSDAENVFNLERERIEDDKSAMLDEIDMLRTILTDEQTDISRVPLVDHNTPYETVQSVHRMLKFKNDRTRYCTFAEEFAILGAHGLEWIFNGQRDFFGYYPDLTDWHNVVGVKLRRMRFDVSNSVSGVMKKLQIGFPLRFLFEMIPSAVIHMKTRQLQSGQAGAYSALDVDDDINNIMNT